MLDCSGEFRSKAGDLRLVLCSLGIRQQAFELTHMLLMVDPLFKIHVKSSPAGFSNASVFSSLFPA